MRRRAIAMRDALVRHRWAIGLMESRRNPGPASLRHHDAVIGRLRAAGFNMAMTAHASSLLGAYIHGFALTTTSAGSPADPRRTPAATPARYPATMTDPTLPPILVLGRDTCEDTVRSRALLVGRGITHTYREVDQDADADAWIRRLNDGQSRTPTILIGDLDDPDTILREPPDAELLAALGIA